MFNSIINSVIVDLGSDLLVEPWLQVSLEVAKNIYKQLCLLSIVHCNSKSLFMEEQKRHSSVSMSLSTFVATCFYKSALFFFFNTSLRGWSRGNS